MTERFTASNGWSRDGLDIYGFDGGLHHTIFPDDPIATLFVEYGRHLERTQRDTELGRWRSQEHPDYVVRALGYGEMFRVTKEATMETLAWSPREYRSPGFSDITPVKVILEYLDAQEPPQPWLDAKPGDVWVLTIDGEERAAVIDNEGWASVSDESINLADGEEADRITAGRRIYPEQKDEEVDRG